METKPVLALDLDGTVRKNISGKSFIESLDDIMLMEGIEPLIWHYKNSGYLIFGISNQGGVAFGHKTEETVAQEMVATTSLFERNPFDVISYCPFMENATAFPYNHRSLLRKPNIGMLAQFEGNMWMRGTIVDWDNSLLVGDRPEDEQCAANAGLRFMWIKDFLNPFRTAL